MLKKKQILRLCTQITVILHKNSNKQVSTRRYTVFGLVGIDHCSMAITPLLSCILKMYATILFRRHLTTARHISRRLPVAFYCLPYDTVNTYCTVSVAMGYWIISYWVHTRFGYKMAAPYFNARDYFREPLKELKFLTYIYGERDNLINTLSTSPKSRGTLPLTSNKQTGN